MNSEIDKGFSDVSEIVLGRPLANLRGYANWLQQDLPTRIREGKSSKSGKEIHIIGMGFYEDMEGNLVTIEEALEYGENKLELEEVEKLGIENASKQLAKIKTTTAEVVFMENMGTEKCVCYGPTQYCYQSSFCWFSKYMAYCHAPRRSEYCFGSCDVLDCNFCIKCHGSANLSRCFEVSDSNACRDCYFCHNCENLVDCMLCFNTKNKQYAIANVEVGKERYLEIKKKILAEIVDELEKTKKFRWTIYNVGCRKN